MVGPRSTSGGKTKTVKVLRFGQYLESLRLKSRKRQPPSVEAVAQQLRDKGIRINHSTLRGYEYGWVDKPDPVVLMGLSEMYRTDLQCLVAVLQANRINAKLTDIQLDRILRDTAETAHAETGAAARLAEIHLRLIDISAELVTLAEPTNEPRESPADPRASASSGD